MFLDFFYKLRDNGVPVSTREYLDLIKVISTLSEAQKTIGPTDFYYMARNCLVKDLKYYDAYDVTFSQSFSTLVSESDFKNKLRQWLESALKKNLSEEQRRNALKLPPKDLIDELQKRIEQQKERHDGGNHFVGTGGTSPFGHSGFNPQGVRIGGQGGGKSALMVAGMRQYQDYRSDISLNVRQIKMALKKLKRLKKQGPMEISIDKTIKKTCDNGGDIELVFEKTRKNNLKLLLLMDVGGSMDPHARRVEELFSAAHQLNHFKEFKSFYFHNIIYDHVYQDALFRKKVPVKNLVNKYDQHTRVIMVGDAAMAPYELFDMNQGMLEFYQTFMRTNLQKSGLTGYARLKMLKEKFPKLVWINPEPFRFWNLGTAKAIKEIVPMFFLGLQGLEDAVSELVK